MAITPGTVATAHTNGSSVNSITIDKPSGVVSGDLMIAQVTRSNTNTITGVPSGWTLLRVDGSGAEPHQYLYYKIAGASEPSSYTWTYSATSTDGIGGGIIKITGYDMQSVVNNNNGRANASSNTADCNSFTPPAGCLIMLFINFANVGNVDVGAYAVATSPPTFTEAWDFAGSGGQAPQVAMAYGVRSAATAMGTASASLQTGGGVGDRINAAQIVAINPGQDVLVTPSLLSFTSAIGETPIVPDVILMTAALQDAALPDWQNTGKSAAGTWTATPKS